MKNKRHAEILSIIENQTIRTQEELSAILRQRGYCVTQATVSRDIKQLRLQKITNHKGIHYVVESEVPAGISSVTVDKYISVLKTVITGADNAMNIAVIKTLSGTAGAAAAAMEAMGFEGIIGTLAGDDTLLVLFAGPEEAKEFCQKVNQDYVKS